MFHSIPPQSQVDADGLRKYLVDDKQFAEARVNTAIERLQKCKGKNTQNRLESFFGPVTIKHAEKKVVPPTKGGKGKGKMASGPAAKKQKK
jgi:flap endonuclease-1